MLNIVMRNYERTILMMKTLIKQWSTTKLTVLGRIIVLKTLIVPKIIHLIIYLPNPHENFIKYINK